MKKIADGRQSKVPKTQNVSIRLRYGVQTMDSSKEEEIQHVIAQQFLICKRYGLVLQTKEWQDNLNDVTQVDGYVGEALFALNQPHVQLGFLVKLSQLLL